MFVRIKRSPKARLLGHNYKSLWLLTVTKKTTFTKGRRQNISHTNKMNPFGTGLLLQSCNFHQTLLNKLFDANSNWKFARNVLGFDAWVQGKICATHNTSVVTTIAAEAAAKKNTHVHFELELIWKSTKSITWWKCIVYEYRHTQQFSNFQVLLLMMMMVLLLLPLLLLLLLYDRTCFALIVNRRAVSPVWHYKSIWLISVEYSTEFGWKHFHL